MKMDFAKYYILKAGVTEGIQTDEQRIIENRNPRSDEELKEVDYVRLHMCNSMYS